MNPIAFINGINSDGSASTDLLCAEMKKRGHPVIELNYPHTRFWQAGSRKVQLDRASRCIDQIQAVTHEPVHIAAHSFGCLITRRMMQLNQYFNLVFLFAPADDMRTYYPRKQMRRMWVVHNNFDDAIKWGNLLPNHDFGNLGRYGYQGCDDQERITNINASWIRQGDNNHGYYFGPGHRQKWADTIEEAIELYEIP